LLGQLASACFRFESISESLVGHCPELLPFPAELSHLGSKTQLRQGNGSTGADNG